MFNHSKKALAYSLAGLRTAFNEEETFRLVLLQLALAVVFLIIFPLSYAQKAFLLISAFLCLIVEFLNSALENIVDLVTNDWHILAKKAKDMGSAAQLAAQVSFCAQILLIIWESTG
ncbi:MAG: diacylglycerol kinase [Acidaminococcales bacterium]|jgi:diacylglycerol kinase (ATP)|nr:diacylglycerol kinase [Acidaminococcales bacterium]